MVKKKKNTQNIAVTIPVSVEATPTYDLRVCLEEIKKRDGVIGYILRNSSAVIDLKDPTKIIEYAALSSTLLKTGEELLKTFDLGDISTIILEGNKVKILALTIGDHHLSIFMEKNVDHNAITKELY